MSLQQWQGAQLAGHIGPIYPPSIGTVASGFTAKSTIGLSAGELDQVASGCPGYESSFAYPMTTDGNVWYRSVRFRVQGGAVVVLIPMANDTSMREDSRLDRMPAAYMTDHVVPSTVEVVVRRLGEALHRAAGRGR